MRRHSLIATRFPALVALTWASWLTGCSRKEHAEEAAPVASAAPSAVGSAEAMRRKTEFLPPPDVIAQTNNPAKLAPYAGPTGTVRGVLRVSGDEAPDTTRNLADAKADCDLARPTFGKLFREGAERRLADALIAVSGYEGYVVPPNYDSMIAKIIVHDHDRPSAIRRARRCLDEMVIEGPRTNIPFLRRLMDHPAFRAGDFDTGFVARFLAESKSA